MLFLPLFFLFKSSKKNPISFCRGLPYNSAVGIIIKGIKGTNKRKHFRRWTIRESLFFDLIYSSSHLLLFSKLWLFHPVKGGHNILVSCGSEIKKKDKADSRESSILLHLLSEYPQDTISNSEIGIFVVREYILVDMTNKNRQRDIKGEQKRASSFFHTAPYQFNCAQAILKAWQKKNHYSDEDLEVFFRSKGGGRAEGGVCGALWAAQQMLSSTPEVCEELTKEFEAKVGAKTCQQLKGRCGRSCIELVEITEDLLLSHLSQE